MDSIPEFVSTKDYTMLHLKGSHKGGHALYLKAKILKVEIVKNQAFHEKTGKPHPSYFLEASVVDIDTGTSYRCSFRKSLKVEQLAEVYRQDISEADRDTIAAEVEGEAKEQIEGKEVILLVKAMELGKLLVSYVPDEDTKM